MRIDISWTVNRDVLYCQSDLLVLGSKILWYSQSGHGEKRARKWVERAAKAAIREGGQWIRVLLRSVSVMAKGKGVIRLTMFLPCSALARAEYNETAQETLNCSISAASLGARRILQN